MHSIRLKARFAATTAVFLALMLGAVNVTFAQQGIKSMNINEQGIFLDGYDVVAYFTTNEATPGSPQHSTAYNGATLYFASNANKETFEANPPKFMPKYGGFCAFAVANGKPGVKSNPKQFKLYNGELLMFFDDLYEGKRFNTSVPWNADELALYGKAEANWPKMSK